MQTHGSSPFQKSHDIEFVSPSLQATDVLSIYDVLLSILKCFNLLQLCCISLIPLFVGEVTCKNLHLQNKNL